MTNAVRENRSVRMSDDEVNELLGQLDARIWGASNANDLDELLALKSELYALLKDNIPRKAKNAIGQNFLKRVNDALTQMSVNRAGFKIERTREALKMGLGFIWNGKPSGTQLHQLRKIISSAEAALDEMTRGHLFHVGMVKHCGSEAARDKTIAELRAIISELKKFMTEHPLIQKAAYKVLCTQNCVRFGYNFFYGENPLADKLSTLQDIIKKAADAVTELSQGELFSIGMIKLCGDKDAADKVIAELRSGIAQLEGFVSELNVRVNAAQAKKARHRENQLNRALENQARAHGGNNKKKG